jgi:hypothetical protein
MAVAPGRRGLWKRLWKLALRDVADAVRIAVPSELPIIAASVKQSK